MSSRGHDINKVQAILFDQHLTITTVTEDSGTVTKRLATSVGIDLEDFTEEDFKKARDSCDESWRKYQIDNDVGIDFGNEIHQWAIYDRMFFDALGLIDIEDETIIRLEEAWREFVTEWEVILPDAKAILAELQSRGYLLGLCTRRPENPTHLLKKWEILDYFTTMQWTSVPGYAKPSPYTLILAADELDVNPLRCAFVGNWVNSDIHAAQRAGMIPVLTTWANPEEAKLAPEGIIIINKISELLNLFRGPE
ncbi:MAG: HAD family hydrolase [Candidatus Thorarchaeota archaeon]